MDIWTESRSVIEHRDGEDDLANQTYKSVIIGLRGIGAQRPDEAADLPLYGTMPNSHASAYHRCPDTDVVAVCDLDEGLLSDFEARWKDVWPDLRLYNDYREMLQKENPDIVSVATGDHLHADITVVSAEHASTRAVICEKPIATTLADADRMIEATEKAGVLLSIEHSRRWYPSFLAARELIRGGDIGNLKTIVCDLFSQRAMMFRNGTHLLDMICFFADSTPQWVMAELESGFEDFTEYVGDGGHDPGTDPDAAAYIRFENGVRAYFNCRKMDFPGSQMYLTCEDGRIEISDREAVLVRATTHREWSRQTIVPTNYMHQGQAAYVPEIVDKLENGGDLVSTGREARKTLQIMLGILESHHAGNVRVDLKG
jgi:predicted dehydrogenase